MSIFNNHKKGCIRSPQDNRDIPLSAFQAPIDIPETYHTDMSKFGVNNQGSQNSCVGQTLAKLKEEQEYRDIGEVKHFSPRYIYALSKKHDNWDGEGTYLRIAAKMLVDYGVCENEYFEEDTTLAKYEYKNWNAITPEANKNASYFKAKGYAVVNPDFDSMKQAIYQNKTVMFGFTMSSYGWKLGDVRPPKTLERKGGHAVLGTGFDNNYIYFLNSWDGWGFEGFGRFQRNYSPFECRTITDIPTQLLINAKSMYKLLRDKKDKLQRVFACKNGYKRWIINPPTLNTGHKDGIWDKDMIVDVDTKELSKYIEGDTIQFFHSPFNY